MRCNPRQLLRQIPSELLLASILMGLTSGCSPTGTSVPTPPPTTTSAASAVPESTVEIPLQKMCALIARRLDLMPGVAQAKWNRKLPITDEKREHSLLAKLAAEGNALEISPEFTRAFFQAQITAAKLIQQQAFQEWTVQQSPPFANAPDLERTIRPQIDEINGQMLNMLAELWQVRTNSQWTAALQRAIDTEFQSATWNHDVLSTATQPLHDAAAAQN